MNPVSWKSNMEIQMFSVSPEVLSQYLTLVETVFHLIPKAQLRENTRHFGQQTRIFAAVEKARFVSCLFLYPVSLGDWILGGIGGVATLPSYRGRGLSGLLLDAAISYAEDHFCALLLWTRIPAFFNKKGFEDASHLFEIDPGGSLPMIRCTRGEKDQFSGTGALWPRIYF